MNIENKQKIYTEQTQDPIEKINDQLLSVASEIAQLKESLKNKENPAEVIKKLKVIEKFRLTLQNERDEIFARKQQKLLDGDTKYSTTGVWDENRASQKKGGVNYN